jgi:hypothetical protein
MIEIVDRSKGVVAQGQVKSLESRKQVGRALASRDVPVIDLGM